MMYDRAKNEPFEKSVGDILSLRHVGKYEKCSYITYVEEIKYMQLCFEFYEF